MVFQKATKKMCSLESSLESYVSDSFLHVSTLSDKSTIGRAYSNSAKIRNI